MGIKKNSSNSHWISLSDMMTGLMIIFLFLSILSIDNVKKREEQKNKIVKEYKNTKVEIYNDLNNQFKDKFKEWNMELDKNLTIRFLNPELMFEFDSFKLKKKFKFILNEFIPLYFNIINKDKYKKVIKEIRIEGHTSKEDKKKYIYNIELSQKRSNSVLQYIVNNNYFKNLTEDKKNNIIFWLSTNGLGYSRIVDSNNNYIFYTNEGQDRKKSRRVEFKIITNSDELLEKIIKQINK